MNNYFGWVPVLTSRLLDINISKYFNDQQYQSFKFEEDEYYFTNKIIRDIKGKKRPSWVVFKLTNKNIKSIAIMDQPPDSRNFSSFKSFFREVQVIHNLALIKVDVDSLNEERLLQYFIALRDIFHKHTHHNRDNDVLLWPVYAENEKEAIELIIKQYEEKILDYLQKIKHIVEIADYTLSKKDIENSQHLISKGSGELNHGLSLVNMSYKNNLLNNNEFETLKFCFERGISSINIFQQKLATLLQIKFSSGPFNNFLLASLNLFVILSVATQFNKIKLYFIKKDYFNIFFKSVTGQILSKIFFIALGFISLLIIFNELRFILRQLFLRIKLIIKKPLDIIIEILTFLKNYEYGDDCEYGDGCNM